MAKKKFRILFFGINDQEEEEEEEKEKKEAEEKKKKISEGDPEDKANDKATVLFPLSTCTYLVFALLCTFLSSEVYKLQLEHFAALQMCSPRVANPLHTKLCDM